MSIDQLANQDFEKAHSKGVWRRMINKLTGKTNELLPFDEVRNRIPIKGQHYVGLKEVPMENIVGSFGRYQDFDRAFLPLQKRTKDRWISIDKAHHFQTPLPPIELYKLGDIYFVKDGNHRVSVAREQGQLEVDAYVTEIDIPVELPIDTKMDDLSLKEEYAHFLTTSRLKELRPDANIEVTVSGLYDQLLLHIDVHRWFICDEVGSEVPYEDAVVSWYDHIYKPIIDVIRATRLIDEFPGFSEADVAMLIIDYLSYIQILDTDTIEQDELVLKASAGKSLVRNYPIPGVRKLVNVLNRTNWLDNVILNQERKIFINETDLLSLRPEANIETTIPGQYNILREHIAVHRWYLGEQSKGEIPEEQVITSWFDNVYTPIVKIVLEQGILEEFPNRTETDLYLWIIEHQYYLREMWGDEVTIETAAEKFSEDFSERTKKRLGKVFKKKPRDEPKQSDPG